ncbi:hypothetical protein WA026_010207 [Henosepilachna vigintioctopunctata]|uniref:Uncharacterized protein n=1 Tax=Henosepilachna vigintioctopunctata TaxID=420089 RepID=A0AAW1UHK0_9CUCU
MVKRTIPGHFELGIPDWVLDPFSHVKIAMSPQLEEEHIELTTNEEKNQVQKWLSRILVTKTDPAIVPGIVVNRSTIPDSIPIVIFE